MPIDGAKMQKKFCSADELIGIMEVCKVNSKLTENCHDLGDLILVSFLFGLKNSPSGNLMVIWRRSLKFPHVLLKICPDLQ